MEQGCSGSDLAGADRLHRDPSQIRMARGDKRPSRALREAIVANLIFGVLGVASTIAYSVV
jgi:hypothetical protein